MSDEDEDKRARGAQVWALKRQIVNLLASVPIELQMVTLNDAVATVIAQFPQDKHQRLMQRHVEGVLRMIPLNVALLKKAQEGKPN